MRRSGSSSCMLRPKNSFSSEDVLAASEHSPLAVTVLNTRRLPSYSTERYYMLSEIEEHAHSVQFLCDLCGAGGAEDDSTASLSEDDDGHRNDDDKYDDEVRPDGAAPHENLEALSRTKPKPVLPPCVMLYILWRPSTYPSAKSFVEGAVEEAVRSALDLNGVEVDDSSIERGTTKGGSSHILSPLHAPSSPSSPRSPSLQSPPPSPTRSSNGAGAGAVPYAAPPPPSPTGLPSPRRRKEMEERRKGRDTRVYLVVDKVSPVPPPGGSETVRDGGDDDIDEFGGFPPLPSLGTTTQTNHDAADVGKTCHTPDHDDDWGDAKRRHHAAEVMIAESLARTVASSPFLRDYVDGVAVGVTSEVRAAPGLETVLDAVGHGATERRRSKPLRRVHRTGGPRDDGDRRFALLRDRPRQKSPLGVVTTHPDDLVGLDPERETDAVEGALQSRVCAEWNGLGNHITFAGRAQTLWRECWNGGPGEGEGGDPAGGDGAALNNSLGKGKKRRVPRLSSRQMDDHIEMEKAEDLSTVMVVAFLFGVAAYLWGRYGEQLRSFAKLVGLS